MACLKLILKPRFKSFLFFFFEQEKVNLSNFEFILILLIDLKIMTIQTILLIIQINQKSQIEKILKSLKDLLSKQCALLILIYATIATMSLFQITLQEIWLMKVWQVWFWKPQGQQSILLSNGIFFFGCFIGTQITKFLQKQSSKFIFLLSDLLNLFANYNFYLLFQQNFGYLSHKNRVDIYLITRSFIGIAVGINYTQALIYVKQISYKTKKGYLFLLIPLQLQIGLTLGNDSPNIMLFCGISTVVRMILLIVIDIETPNYYFFIKQDIRETKRILGQIHWDNVDIQLQIINDFQQRKANQEILSKKYLKKYIRSLALVIITQLSGFQMMINYYPEIYGFQNGLGFPMIIYLIIFGRYFNKSYQIILAQLIVCLGLQSQLIRIEKIIKC